MGKDKGKAQAWLDPRPSPISRPPSRQPSPAPPDIRPSPALLPQGSTFLRPTSALGGASLRMTGQPNIAALGTPSIGQTSSVPPATTSKGWKQRIGLTKIGSALKQGGAMTSVLKPVVDGVEELTNIFQGVALSSSEYGTLLGELDDLLDSLGSCITGQETIEVTNCIKNLCDKVKEEIDRVKERHKDKGLSRHLDATENMEDVLRCYRRVNAVLSCLLLNINMKIANHQQAESYLNYLRQATTLSGVYNSAESDDLGRRSCTEDTRVDVIQTILQWAHSPRPEAIYWLNGMAGTGKTTIAYTLCQRLNQAHMLGASFFCSRSLPQCRSVKYIFPSIAYQLARFSLPYRRALIKVLQTDQDAHTKALRVQFEELIVKPLQQATSALTGTKVTVVIDALDECENEGSQVRDLLDLLIKEELNLPIKVFLSSRPESEIYPRMSAPKAQTPRPHLVLHELATHQVSREIEAYLRAELRNVDISNAAVATLVSKSGVLFIYASTAVSYIQDGVELGDMDERIAAIIGATSASYSLQDRSIDVLYSTILTRVFSSPRLEDRNKDRMRSVLWTVICAQEPLTIMALAALLRPMSAAQIRASILPLRSILHIAESTGVVTTLHASFPQFILSERRSGIFHCPSPQHHAEMCWACLDVIRTHDPQFNVCGLQSSFELDKDIKGINERVEQTISTEMTYACRYWAAHLGSSQREPRLETALADFLSARLLLWMEVLNLKGLIKDGPRIIQTAEQWITSMGLSQCTVDLAHDAWRFVFAFAGHEVSMSTPHIYVSMVPFWPGGTPISAHYVKRCRGLIKVTGTGLQQRQHSPFRLASWSNQSRRETDFTYCRYLTTGRLIVANSGTVRVLDEITGQLIVVVVDFYESDWSEGYIWAVAASSDGEQIAVCTASPPSLSVYSMTHGKSPRSITLNSPRIDPDLGALLAAFTCDSTCLVLVCHGVLLIYNLEGEIMLVASLEDDALIRGYDPDDYSILLSPCPNGSSFALRCSDGVRVWSIRTCALEQILGPLEGTNQYTSCISFSPDGQRVVAVSITISIWDANDGRLLLDQIGGITPDEEFVTCISFSPNGAYIISGYNKGSIRLYDPLTGQMVRELPRATDTTIQLAVLSTDGSRLISAGNYRGSNADPYFCVQVWSMRNGSHQLQIDSLGIGRDRNFCRYSPDGSLVLGLTSGYEEPPALHVWDAQTGYLLYRLFTNGKEIYATEFSLDGTNIITVSELGEVLLWDTKTGYLVNQCMLHDPEAILQEYSLKIRFSADKESIVAVTSEGFAIWNVGSGSLTRRRSNTELCARDWNLRDGRLLSSGDLILAGVSCSMGTIWIFYKGNTTFQVYKPVPGNSLLSPDGSYLVTLARNPRFGGPRASAKLSVWNPNQGPLLLTTASSTMHELKHNDFHNAVFQFSPDSMYLIAWGRFTNPVTLVELGTSRVSTVPLDILPLRGSSGEFSPDRTHFATISKDDYIRIWDISDFTIPSRSPESQHTTVSSDNNLNSLERAWKLRKEDGWIIDSQSQRIVWVPTELRPLLLLYRNTAMLSTIGSVKVDFSEALIGDRWTECYVPAPSE